MFIYLFLEISLFDYMRKVYKDHIKNCNRVQNNMDHYNLCRPGLSLEATSLFFVQICEGLYYLHEIGYTHGDIKCKLKNLKDIT